MRTGMGKGGIHTRKKTRRIVGATKTVEETGKCYLSVKEGGKEKLGLRQGRVRIVLERKRRGEGAFSGLKRLRSLNAKRGLTGAREGFDTINYISSTGRGHILSENRGESRSSSEERRSRGETKRRSLGIWGVKREVSTP